MVVGREEGREKGGEERGGEVQTAEGSRMRAVGAMV